MQDRIVKYSDPFGGAKEATICGSSNGRQSQKVPAKPVGVGAVFQRLIPTGERSGLQTHIATMENALVAHAEEKLTAFVGFKAAIRPRGQRSGENKCSKLHRQVLRIV